MVSILHYAYLSLLTLLLSGIVLSAQSLSENWDSRFDLPGIHGQIESTIFDENGNLFLVGQIHGANGAPEAKDFLRWNGEQWMALGVFTNPFIVDGIQMQIRYNWSNHSLASYNGNVYAIATDADNSSLSYIVAWNGERWSILEGAVFNGWVRKLLVHGPHLYVGGYFSSMLGKPSAKGFVYWNGQEWQNPKGEIAGQVSDFVFDENGTPYLLGNLSRPGDGTAYSGVKWNGQQWTPFGDSTTNSQIHRIVTSGTTLYAITSHRNQQEVLQLEGNDWKAISANLKTEYATNSATWQLLTPDTFGRIYLSSQTSDSYPSHHFLFRRSGNRWEKLPHKFSGPVQELLFEDNQALIAIGDFIVVNDSLIANNIARWDGNTWQAFASEGRKNQGLVGTVATVEVFNGHLYAGGSNLQSLDHPKQQGILRWSEQSGWEDVGGGVDGSVSTIRPHPDGGLIVAGCFNRAGTVSAHNIAHWDGTAWHSIGNGTDVCINNLSTVNNSIYAVGGTSLFHWTGTEWKHIHIPANRTSIEAVAVSNDGSVYVGGRFDSLNGLPVNNIACWKHGEWQGLGSGLKMRHNSYVFLGPEHATVRALAVDGEHLYAGGTFDSAGNIPAFQIARWDGQSWQAMDSGLVGAYYQGTFGAPNDQARVHSIRIFDGTVYAAGRFSAAGSWDYDSPHLVHTPGLVRWDEESNVWNPLFDYTDYGAVDIAFSDDYIYAAGFGTRAAQDKFAYGIARTQYPSEQLSAPECAEELSFGSALVNRSVQRDLIITNPTSSNRTLVGTVAVQDKPFAVQGDGSFRLAPGQKLHMPITFRPTTTGAVAGQATVHHNSTVDATPLSVRLSGVGTALSVAWSVNPTRLDFGTHTQRQGTHATLAVTVANSIHSNAEFTLEPAQPNAPFFIERENSWENTPPPVTLKSGEEHTWEIKLDLSQPGTHASQFIIIHNGEPDGRITIPLVGVVAPQFAAIHVTPNSINFDSVEVTHSTTQPIIITSDPRTNDWASYRIYNHRQSFRVSATSETQELTPGMPDTVWVSFAPDAIGSFTDTLTLLKIFGSHTDTLRIPVRGVGVQPVAHIRVSTTSIDFGEIAAGDSATASIVISNLPNASGNLVLSGSTPALPFRVEGTEQNTVEPGQNSRLAITFTPQFTGQHYSKLYLTHNSPDLPSPVEIILRGSSSISSLNEHSNSTKTALRLQVEPNPINKSGVVRFHLAHASDIVLEVFALDGRSILRLAEGQYTAGEHLIEWDSEELAAGTYLCRLTGGEEKASVMIHVE